MSKSKFGIAIVAVVFGGVLFLGAQANKSTARRVTPQTKKASPQVESKTDLSVDPAKIRAHVKFLASDLLEGRGTGQRGGDIAAEYIATEFAFYGLKPAGDDGTYF